MPVELVRTAVEDIREAVIKVRVAGYDAKSRHNASEVIKTRRDVLTAGHGLGMNEETSCIAVANFCSAWLAANRTFDVDPSKKSLRMTLENSNTALIRECDELLAKMH